MSSSSLEFNVQVAAGTANMTVNNFVNADAAGTLILRPLFQRNLVWDREQQSFLVDSILRGLPVPEVYVQSTTSADGDEQTLVVDGQQRISTCLRFVHGELRLTASDDLDDRWKGRTFSELQDPLKQRFRSFELVVRKLPQVEDAVLREIFRRLNKTVEPLEPQELRHAAVTGPFIGFIETLASQPMFGEVGVFSARDYLRRRNDEFMAEVIFAIYAGAYPNKKEGIDEFFLTFDGESANATDLELLARTMGRVMAQLESIAGDIRRTRFRNKSDFYSLLVTMAQYAERLPLDGSQTIGLRDALIEFSNRVNDTKKYEGQAGASGDAVSFDDPATRYLRAVERAASDRLSRVRRQEALEEVIGSILADGTRIALDSSDSGWMVAGVDDSDAPTEEERSQSRRLILETT
ncbi:DUF262 domain-containing protein [Diaminobutyricimonas sp. TR449]|uniref:DUF262 domain-containing protein n=1 Tax=Diaminobutyricimonas sp. TR449 TaxID=2708076 RepID=UPI001422C80D|nr:DUF262 domain-containing protein [Diaminobutyricimonas sp. TR449]